MEAEGDTNRRSLTNPASAGGVSSFQSCRANDMVVNSDYTEDVNCDIKLAVTARVHPTPCWSIWRLRSAGRRDQEEHLQRHELLPAEAGELPIHGRANEERFYGMT